MDVAIVCPRCECAPCECARIRGRRGFISMLGAGAAVAMAAPVLRAADGVALISQAHPVWTDWRGVYGAPQSVGEALAASMMQTKEMVGARILNAAAFRAIVAGKLNELFEKEYDNMKHDWEETFACQKNPEVDMSIKMADSSLETLEVELSPASGRIRLRPLD